MQASAHTRQTDADLAAAPSPLSLAFYAAMAALLVLVYLVLGNATRDRNSIFHELSLLRVRTGNK
jgi:hypothetical protein